MARWDSDSVTSDSTPATCTCPDTAALVSAALAGQPFEVDCALHPDAAPERLTGPLNGPGIDAAVAAALGTPVTFDKENSA